MNIQEELRINKRQLAHVFAGTEVRNLFDEIIKELVAKGFCPEDSIVFLMDRAYSLGMVHGKRAERARRRSA